MEREGKTIYWLQDNKLEKATDLIEKFLNDKKMPNPKLKISEIYYGPKQHHNEKT